MVLLEFISVAVSIVKLFHKSNPEDGAGLSAELVFPLLLSIAMSHIPNVCFSSHSRVTNLMNRMKSYLGFFPVVSKYVSLHYDHTRFHTHLIASTFSR